MKRYLLFLTLCTLPLSAQWRRFGSDPLHPSGSIGVGFTTPANPTANRLDTGWNVSGGFGATTNYFGVMLDGMFTDLGVNRRTLNREGARNGSEKYWAITVNPIFHVNERGPIDFYVTAGGGLYSQISRYRAEFNSGPGGRDFDLISTNTIFKPGVNAGAGFAFRIGDLTNMEVFAEARYHRMFVGPRDVSFIPVTVGVRF